MEVLIEKINALKNIEPEWLSIIHDEIENDVEPSIPELPKAYNELWNALRESIKDNQEKTREFFERYLGEEGEWILKDVEKSLKIYFAFSMLRKFGEKDEVKTKKAIDYMFENVVIYFDPHFSNNYYQFQYENQEQFIENAKTLDALVSYYVGRHYTRKAIENDIQDETGLSESLCDYIAEKIFANYTTLQMNFIIDIKTSQAE